MKGRSSFCHVKTACSAKSDEKFLALPNLMRNSVPCHNCSAKSDEKFIRSIENLKLSQSPNHFALFMAFSS